MRIMHMILSRGFAGSERTAAQLANVQCQTHDVAIILKRSHANRHGVSITQWLDRRVRVIEVGNWFPQKGVARAIEEWKPEIVHAHLRRSTKLLARIRPPCPTVVTVHIRVNGPHFADMDGIICIARWQLDEVPVGYRGRVYHIDPGYIPHRRLSAEEVAALKRELNVQPGEFLVGGVGRLSQKKGFDVLIEAFKQAAIANAKLAILGEGSERKRLQRLCTPRISLPGFRANIKDYYQAFDLFVCASRDEPFGFVLLEALDAGVPVLASDALGPREVLQTYPGTLFRAGNVEELAALLRTHCTPSRAKTPQDLTRYSLDSIAQQTEAAYRELATARLRS